MRRRPPRSTRTDTLFPYTTLFRSDLEALAAVLRQQRQEALHHGVLEHREEGFLVGLRGGAPVAADHELADPRHVEVLVEELAEVLFLLLGADRRVAELPSRPFLQVRQEACRLPGADVRRGGLHPAPPHPPPR